MDNMDNQAEKRTVLEISGEARVKFLDALVTNSVAGKGGEGDCLVYSALLTPQGKYLFDFFLLLQGTRILLDVSSARADALKASLSLYKLRADVTITDTPYCVTLSRLPPNGDAKKEALAFADPRHPSMGWRIYRKNAPFGKSDDFTKERIKHVIGEYKSELIVNETYILEAGFERLNGVDFKKGCFVGQEIVARMKHKTALRKGLCRVRTDGATPHKAPLFSGGKNVGHLCSTAEGMAIAYLHYGRLKDKITTEQGQNVELDWRPT